MGETCEICGQAAVDAFRPLWRFGERPVAIVDALRQGNERTAWPVCRAASFELNSELARTQFPQE